MALPGTGQVPLSLALPFSFRPPSREVEKAISYLDKHPLDEKQSPVLSYTIYTIYQRSRAASGLGGEMRIRERRSIDQLLFGQQSDNGSWSSSKEPYGPAFATAMAVLALTSDKLPSPTDRR